MSRSVALVSLGALLVTAFPAHAADPTSSALPDWESACAGAGTLPAAHGRTHDLGALAESTVHETTAALAWKHEESVGIVSEVAQEAMAITIGQGPMVSSMGLGDFIGVLRFFADATLDIVDFVAHVGVLVGLEKTDAIVAFAHEVCTA